jgi:sugar phosphate permease
MRGKLFYGWVMVAVTALVALTTAGTRAAPGAFLLAMQQDTGFSRASLSVAAGAGLLLYGLAGPIAGAMMNRLGVKRVAAISVLTTGATLVATSQSREIWQFALFFGLVTGLSTGLVASSFGAMVATRWFVKYRGMVTGIFGASSSVGQLIFIPLLAGLAASVGWREGAIVMAAVTACLVVPILIFMRDDPSSMGLTPLGVAPGSPAAAAAKAKADPGIMRRALGSRDFWLLAGTYFTCGATSNGLVGQHFIAFAHDHGFDTAVGAGALGLIGLFNFMGVLGSGWLTDRFDPRRLLAMYYILRGLSLVVITFFLDSTINITIFAIFFGLDYFATVPPTVALTADRFGRHNVGVVYGWVFASHMLGGALAAVFAGAIRDALGDYQVAYIVAGSLAVMGGLLALQIRRTTPPRPAAMGAAPAAA